MKLTVAQHSKLDLKVLTIKLDQPLSDLETPASVMELLSVTADSPFETLRSEAKRDNVKSLIRDVFRQGGYKPTGRGKPASEYLFAAVGKDKLSSINLVVDVCNVVSLHSGVPISVVDLEKCERPLSVAEAPANSEYVFNRTGQTIKLDGLLCLFDNEGPCANGVKDSQRTKTSESTRHVLALIWGSNELPGLAEKTLGWFRKLIETVDGVTTEVIHGGEATPD